MNKICYFLWVIFSTHSQVVFCTIPLIYFPLETALSPETDVLKGWIQILSAWIGNKMIITKSNFRGQFLFSQLHSWAHDNVTMFSGHSFVGYCIVSKYSMCSFFVFFLVPEALRILLSRCREAKQLSRVRVCNHRLKILIDTKSACRHYCFWGNLRCCLYFSEKLCYMNICRWHFQHG